MCRLRCLRLLHMALTEIPWSSVVLGSSRKTRRICSLSLGEWHHFQAVSGDDDHGIFLFRLLLLSQALILALQGWQVSGARAPGLWLEAPGEFHARPSLVSHRFCHFPLLSIRAASSPREEPCSRQLPGQRGAESSKLLACQPLHQHGGHQGPLSRGCLGRMPQLKLKPFALQHIMHMAGKHGGVKPLERLCVDKRSSWGPRCKHSFTGLSAGKQCCSLRRDRLVRKMT